MSWTTTSARRRESRKPRPQYDEMMRRARRREFGVRPGLQQLAADPPPSRVGGPDRPARGDRRADQDGGVGQRRPEHRRRRMVARIKANVGRRRGRAHRRARGAGEEAGSRAGPLPGRARAVRLQQGRRDDREKEADVIRHATKAILSGRSLPPSCGELNETGTGPRPGAEWTRHSLRGRAAAAPQRRADQHGPGARRRRESSARRRGPRSSARTSCTRSSACCSTRRAQN